MLQQTASMTKRPTNPQEGGAVQRRIQQLWHQRQFADQPNICPLKPDLSVYLHSTQQNKKTKKKGKWTGVSVVRGVNTPLQEAKNELIVPAKKLQGGFHKQLEWSMSSTCIFIHRLWCSLFRAFIVIALIGRKTFGWRIHCAG
jgi:hypothetical protein